MNTSIARPTQVVLSSAKNFSFRQEIKETTNDFTFERILDRNRDNIFVFKNGVRLLYGEDFEYLGFDYLPVPSPVYTLVRGIRTTEELVSGDVLEVVSGYWGGQYFDTDAYDEIETEHLENCVTGFWGQLNTDIDARVDDNIDTQHNEFTEQLDTTISEYTEEVESQAKIVTTENSKKSGLPVSPINFRRIEKDGSTVRLSWKDPDDSIVDGFVLASWDRTVVVKKEGDYPQDLDDGITVCTNNERNKYWKTWYEDEQENPENWYYRGFTIGSNDVVCYDKRNCFDLILYGYRIDEQNPDPKTRVEYLGSCDNYFYRNCYMDFDQDKFYWGDWEDTFIIPKPCALNINGTVDYYISKTNFNFRVGGKEPTNIADPEYDGNFMVEFPAIFHKIWREDNYIYVMISNKKLDSTFECWSCKRADGTYCDKFYMPMFEGTMISEVLRSLGTDAIPSNNNTVREQMMSARLNEDGWDSTYVCDEVLMMLLFPLLFKSTDCHTALGFGAAGGKADTAELLVLNNALLDKGLMYGTKAASANGMIYLGMHNWWGHRWRCAWGIWPAPNGDLKFKMTKSTVDGSTKNDFNYTGDGYLDFGYHTTIRQAESVDGAFIGGMDIIGPDGKYGFIPGTHSSTTTATTYYCASAIMNIYIDTAQSYQAFFGGSQKQKNGTSIFCMHTIAPCSGTVNKRYGASITYRDSNKS